MASANATVRRTAMGFSRSRQMTANPQRQRRIAAPVPRSPAPRTTTRWSDTELVSDGHRFARAAVADRNNLRHDRYSDFCRRVCGDVETDRCADVSEALERVSFL